MHRNSSASGISAERLNFSLGREAKSLRFNGNISPENNFCRPWILIKHAQNRSLPNSKEFTSITNITMDFCMDLPTQNNEFQNGNFYDDVSWAARWKLSAGRAAQSILNSQRSARPRIGLFLPGRGPSLRLDGGHCLDQEWADAFSQKKEVHRFLEKRRHSLSE